MLKRPTVQRNEAIPFGYWSVAAQQMHGDVNYRNNECPQCQSSTTLLGGTRPNAPFQPWLAVLAHPLAPGRSP